MRFPKLKHAGFFGAVGPLLYYPWQPGRDCILGNGLFLWPTGLIIIVTHGHEHDLFGYAVIALSIVLNIALYAAAIMLLWLIVWIVGRIGTAKRQPLPRSRIIMRAGTARPLVSDLVIEGDLQRP